ncbi:MAG: hypothetical protein JO360_18510 [Acidobacteria bacterium]|nr:hypothetical protein [Acidobacteriota bacterium]
MPDPPQSPDQKLEELKKQLEQSSTELNQLTRKRDTLKADVDALSKTVEEIKKTSTDYGQGEAGLKTAQQEYEHYFQTKKHMLEAELGEKTEKIVALIATVDDKIKQKRAEVAALRETATKAESNKEAAKKTLEQKQQDYNNLKNKRANLAANLQKLKDLKVRIEQFDDETKPASMYVLLLELKKVLDDTKIPSPEEYKKALDEATKALENATAQVESTKTAARTSQEALAKAENELKESEQKRLDNILGAAEKV